MDKVTIPDEAWKATGLPEVAAKAVIRAALAAWPGAERESCWFTKDGDEILSPHIILPIPQETKP